MSIKEIWRKVSKADKAVPPYILTVACRVGYFVAHAENESAGCLDNFLSTQQMSFHSEKHGRDSPKMILMHKQNF